MFLRVGFRVRAGLGAGVTALLMPLGHQSPARGIPGCAGQLQTEPGAGLGGCSSALIHLSMSAVCGQKEVGCAAGLCLLWQGRVVGNPKRLFPQTRCETWLYRLPASLVRAPPDSAPQGRNLLVPSGDSPWLGSVWSGAGLGHIPASHPLGQQ